MPLTLDRLLREHDLGLELWAGSASVKLRWVHSIELLDPTPYLPGGELVLTTGQRLKADPCEQRRYVERLVEHGVGALGFGVGVKFQQIPRAVLEACTDLDFPLVCVPHRTPFISVAQRAAQFVAQEEQQEQRRLEDFQRRLTRIALTDGEAGVLEAASKFLERPTFHIRADGGRPEHGSMQYARAAAIIARGDAPRGTQVFVNDHIEMHPLAGASPSWLVTSARPTIRPAQRVVLQHVGSLLALLVNAPDESSTATDEFAHFVGLAFASDSSEDADVLTHFGLNPGECVVTVLRCRRGEAPDPSWRGRLADQIRRTHTNAIVSRISPTELCVIANRRFDDLPGFVGTCELDQRTPHASVTAARKAAESAQRRGLSTLSASDHRIDTALDDVAIRAVAGRFEAELALLRQQERVDLIGALTSYLRHHGSLERASQDVGIHRQTLRTRIQQVQELTRLDLDDADTRALLWIALACPVARER